MAKPTIVINEAGATPGALAKRALPALATADIYQRGGRLVHVVREAVTAPSGEVLPIGRPRIRELPRTLLANALAESVEWQRCSYDKKGNSAAEHADPPRDVVDFILEAGEWAHVRPLRGIAHWPIVAPSGEIITANGYAPAAEYVLTDVPSLKLPAEPSQDDARAAVTKLLDLVAEFPIVSDAGRAAWLAGVLTVLARPHIAGAVPCTVFDAPTPGTGKSLLARMAAAIPTGDDVAPRAVPQEASEWSRVMLGIAIAGEPVVFFDNAKGKVDSAALEAVITSARFTERRLRTNESTECPVPTLFLVTSNNASLSVDLARRSLHCRLVPKEERPELRGGYRIKSPVRYVVEHRSELLTAALTILRAYYVAGRPAVAMRPMGSFEEWSEAVRAPLVWAGCADPAETQDALREAAAAVDLAPLGEALAAWHEVHQDRAVTVAQLVKSATSAPTLSAALCALCETTPDNLDTKAAKAIGIRLGASRDRILGNYRLERVGRASAGTTWRVLRIASAA